MLFTRLFLIGGIILLLIVAVSVNAFSPNNQTSRIIKNTYNTASISTPELNLASLKEAEYKKAEEAKRIAELERLQEIRQEQVDRILAFLISKDSPVATEEIAGIIYDQTVIYNADYKIILAIMGVESGFCAQSFNYNCFGYLNGVRYSNFPEAFRDVVPKVASQYAIVYGTDFISLAKAYGIINWEKGAANLSKYYNQI